VKEPVQSHRDFHEAIPSEKLCHPRETKSPH
jgi:hypothetical protein